MQLAESSRRKIEEFYREFTGDETFRLPRIHFYVGRFSHFFTTLISVSGITFGRRIFILPQHLSLNRQNQKKLPEVLVVHEIAHVLQYRREGFIRFFYKYLRDYLRNLPRNEKWSPDVRRQAYLNIPFEIEARRAGEEYLAWKDKKQDSKFQIPDL